PKTESMQTVARRFLVLAGLMLWQGGFTFYAAVVVPIGMDELGSHTAQGVITRRVAPVINLAGLAALALLVWGMPRQRDARVAAADALVLPHRTERGPDRAVSALSANGRAFGLDESLGARSGGVSTSA